MKITLYTINDCQYSVQEKDYLKANNLSFEEKNLETNRQFLTEMLAVSNNFAGTPVTKIEKDDGQIVILKGFTKEEFDKTLGLTPPPAATSATPLVTDDKSVKPPITSNPAPTPTPQMPEIPPLPQTEPTPIASPTVESIPINPSNAQLDSILNNLQQKAGAPVTK